MTKKTSKVTDVSPSLAGKGTIQAVDETGASCCECKHSIPAGAAKCSECGAYQDWRRHVYSSTNLITAVLAIIPLWVGAYAAWTAAHPSAAAVAVNFGKCGPDEVQTYLANSGDRRAVWKRPLLAIRTTKGAPWRPLEISTLHGDPINEDDLSTEAGEVDVMNLKAGSNGFYTPEEGILPFCRLQVKFPRVGDATDSDVSGECKCE